MKRLIVSETDFTPALDLNPSGLTMKFTGVSRPENVGLFYQQVFDWVDDLKAEIRQFVPATLKLIFRLDYCNSATQKYILMLLEKLVLLKKEGLSLNIEWYYDPADEKMKEDGEDIADAIGLDFNLCEF